MTNAAIINEAAYHLMEEGKIGTTGRAITVKMLDKDGNEIEKVIPEPEMIHTFQHWKSLGFKVKKANTPLPGSRYGNMPARPKPMKMAKKSTKAGCFAKWLVSSQCRRWKEWRLQHEIRLRNAAPGVLPRMPAEGKLRRTAG